MVSGGVSLLCWLALPGTMFYGNHPKLGNKIKVGNMVQFGTKVKIWCDVWSIEGVTVYGYVPEYHVTFRTGKLHNVWRDLHIDLTVNMGFFSLGEGGISRKYWQDISRGGNFHDTIYIFLIKSCGFYFRAGEILAKKSISKIRQNYPHEKCPRLHYA